MIAVMSRLARLRRAAGQLVWVGFHGTEAPRPLLDRIAIGDVGAVVVFGRNLVAREGAAGPETDIGALVALNRELAAAAPVDQPLLLCVDQEGGRVQRVRAPATRWPPMDRLGVLAARDPDAAEALAREVGRAMGTELAAIGFDVDFAPVLDVHTNPANPVIGDRALATTPELVARLGRALAAGLEDGGVLACGKHFPGHGDTHIDSHLALPTVAHDVARLDAIELLPFRAAAEIPMFMTAHVVFPALDPDAPATMSRAVLEDHLRARLGYRGVVVSDDLEMRAIADHFGVPEAAVRSLRAGCDAFLVCHTEALQVATMEALVRAADADVGTGARLEQAAARVATLKARMAGLRMRPRPGLDVLGAAAHQALATRMAALGQGGAPGVDPTER